MKYLITVSDKANYIFDNKECSKEQAIEKAWEWFNERKPNINIIEMDNNDK